MKKTGLFVAALCCTISLSAATAVGDTLRYNYAGNNLFYYVRSISPTNRNVGIITELYGSPYYTDANKPSGDLVLPDTITDADGYKYAVKYMAADLLYGSNITSFTNNNLITTITFCCCYNCTSLTTADLKNATSISSYAFYNAPIQTIAMDKVTNIGMANFDYATYTTAHIGKNLNSIDAQSGFFHRKVKKIEVDSANTTFKLIDGMVYKQLNSTNYNCLVGCVKDTNYLVTIPECVDTMMFCTFDYSKLDVIMPKSQVVGVYWPTDSRNSLRGKMYVNCPLYDAYQTMTGYYAYGTLKDTLLCSFDAVSADNAKGTVAKSSITNCNEITLTATPVSGYRFFRWSDNNTESPRNYEIVADTILTAEWLADNESYIALLSADETMGTVSGEGVYTNGTAAMLTATPKEGYVFAKWSDGNTTNPRSYTVSKTDTLTAIFKIKVEVHVNALSADSTMGSVSGSGVYPENSEVTLTATPLRGYIFTQWNDGNTDNPRTIIASQDTTLTATFAIKPAAVGDTLRFNYAGNNLFYYVRSISPTNRNVGIITELYGSPYYTDANKPSGDLVLPDTITDAYGYKYAVKYMASYAFRGSNITSFTNNYLITELSHGCCYNCTSLTTADLKNATSISDYAFNNAPIQTIVMDKVVSIGMANFDYATYTTAHIGKNLNSIDAQSGFFHSKVKKIEVDSANTTFKLIDGMVYKKLNSTNYNCLVGCVKDTNYLVTIPECVDTMMYRTLEYSKLDVIMPKSQVVGVDSPTDSRNSIRGRMYVYCPLYDAYLAKTGYYAYGTLVDTLLHTITRIATNGEIVLSDTTSCNQVNCTAVAATGYKFSQWSDGVVENPRTIIVESDTTITAEFVAKTPTELSQVEFNNLEVRDGRIYCDSEFRIYDLVGRDVTRLNGNLQGVYIVKYGDKATKVVVK